MLTKKPRVGDKLRFEDGSIVIVKRLDGRICWVAYEKNGLETCFIWGFVSPGGPRTDKGPKIGDLYPNQLVEEVS